MLIKMLENANVATALNEMRVSKKDDVFTINPLYGAQLVDAGKAVAVHELPERRYEVRE